MKGFGFAARRARRRRLRRAPPRTFASSRFLARSRAPPEALRGAPLRALVVPGRHRVLHAAHAPLARLGARVGAGGAAHSHARVRRGILSSTTSRARVPDRNGSRSASVSRASRPGDARAEGDAKSEVKESVSGRFAFAGPDATSPRHETNPKNVENICDGWTRRRIERGRTFDRYPSRLIRRSDEHTRSHANAVSSPSPSLRRTSSSRGPFLRRNVLCSTNAPRPTGAAMKYGCTMAAPRPRARGHRTPLLCPAASARASQPLGSAQRRLRLLWPGDERSRTFETNEVRDATWRGFCSCPMHLTTTCTAD